MPYSRFTEEEKQAIREQYRDNIALFNSYIRDPSDHYKLDMAALEKRLNDPTQVYLYKKGLETRQREITQKRIQEELEARLGPQYKIPGKVYPLSRFFHTELIPSDDPEALAYNEEKMRQYYLHPEAVVQRRFQRLMDTDLKFVADLSKCNDKKGLMLAWAVQNQSVLEEAFEFYNTVNKYPADMLTPEMRQFHGSINRNFEALMDCSEFAKRVNAGFFTVPSTMTQRQSFQLEGSTFDVDHPDLYKLFSENVSAGMTIETKEKAFIGFFQKAASKGVDFKDPSVLTKNVAAIEGGTKPYGSISGWTMGEIQGRRITLHPLTPEQTAGIKKIFNVDYTKEEGYAEPEIPAKFARRGLEAAKEDLALKYAVKNNLNYAKTLDGGDFAKIATSIKGGVFERTFGTTSREYRNLMQALKDFDNPNHVAYQNSMPAKIAANQYLIHKGVSTLEQINALSGTDKERALLAWDIIDTFQKYEDPNSPKIVPGTNRVINQNPPERQPAILDPKDLEEDPLPFPPEPEAEAKKEVALEEDVEEKDNLSADDISLE